MIKQFKIECQKLKQQVYLSFYVINCSNMSEKEYNLGLINNCSIAKNICKDCPYINLIGQKITI